MLKAIRVLLLVVTPLVFLAVWHLKPALLEPSGLRFLSGIVSVLWALEVFVLQRLAAAGDVQGLSSREHERLTLRLASIRRRVWWVGGVGLASSLLLWLMAALDLAASSPLYAFMAGLLFGVTLSYLILVPVWHNETQHFIDEMKRRRELESRRREALDILCKR